MPFSCIKRFVKENRFITLLFIASTAYFMIQHLSHLSWDFSVYMMNAEYLRGVGDYFEVQRPPLMPFALLVLGIFGRYAAELLFIILASGLFFYSTIVLADACTTSRKMFYALSLNAFFLVFATVNGSELLSLAFLELFLAALITDKMSGAFFGLAFLARYPVLGLAPLFLFHKQLWSMIKNGFFAMLAVAPWMMYNYYTTGSALTSIANSYAQNVKFRDYIQQAPEIFHFLEVLNLLTPLLILGAGMSTYEIYKTAAKEKKKDDKEESRCDEGKTHAFFSSARFLVKTHFTDLLMFAFFFLVVVGYMRTPLKIDRYLFNITVPAVYFSAKALQPGMIEIAGRAVKITKKAALHALYLFTLVSFSAAAVLLLFGHTGTIYDGALAEMDQMGIGECALHSNEWVFLNYKGRPTEIAPWQDTVGYYIENGHYFVLFKRAFEPNYTHDRQFIRTHSPLFENKDFIILGNLSTCALIRTPDRSYLEQVSEMMEIKNGYRIKTEPYSILFTNYTI